MKINHILVLSSFIIVFSCKKEGTTTEIPSEKLAESTQSWNGNTLPAYPTGQSKITISKVPDPPKAKLEMHEHLVINASVLIKGELTVIDEFENRFELKEGDPIIELANPFHYGINEGKDNAEIIDVYSRYMNTPITKIKE